MKAVVLLFICIHLFAQDSDTILLKNDAQKFALLAQIDDPRESAAFLELTKAVDPIQRLTQSEAFVKTYSQSWLSPQVYDAAARAAFDLEKFELALQYGRFSLRLLPENPSLLILMSNIEAREPRLIKQSVRDATDALEYLDEIERPPGMTQKDWNALKPQLKASAYFARGRALAAGDPSQSAASLDDLNHAVAWNSEDAESFFLRAIIELRLGQKLPAAADLAFVLPQSQALHDKAQRILTLLAKPNTVGDFIKTLPSRSVDISLRNEKPTARYPEALAAGYAGPQTCKNCHESQFTAWQKTGMARMLRPYEPGNIIGDFIHDSEYSEGDADKIRMALDSHKNQRPYFEVLNKSNWQRFYVDFTIGSKWQQGYVTKLPDGRMQVLPIEYNALQKRWINYWKIIDPPGSARAVIRDFPKLTAATNYQQNCAICHTSQLKADSSKAEPMQHAAFLQPGIDCEMCHGPSARHARNAAKGALDHTEAAQPPFDFRHANNREAVRICAQCHRQSAVREIGREGEMNYSTANSFVLTTWMRSYDAFSRKAFYKDGRFRETTFIVEAFSRSACFRRGAAQCASCHSPHLADFESNQTSLKHRQNLNEMCLQCHGEVRARIASHTHHKADSEASQCVSCHMPRIANAVLFKARSHQIEIPTADLTERFGQDESPNACLLCHSEKQPEWAKEQLAAWAH